MPSLDGKALTTELKQALKREMNFVFAAGSDLSKHYIVLSKGAISGSTAKEAKTATKGGKPISGVCKSVNGMLVFETTDSTNDSQAKALSQLVKKRAKLSSVEVEFQKPGQDGGGGKPAPAKQEQAEAAPARKARDSGEQEKGKPVPAERQEQVEETTPKSAQAGAASGDDEDEDLPDNELFNPESLKPLMKKVARKPFNFGYGHAGKFEDCTLIVKKKGKPKPLMALVKGEKKQKATFGIASAHPEDKTILLLDVMGKQMPQMAKKIRQLLKLHKATNFKKVQLLVGGEPVEDLPEEDEGVEAGGVAAAGEVSPEEKKAKAAEQKAAEDRRKVFKKVRSQWVAVRDQAIQDLEVVKDGARDMYLGDTVQLPIILERVGDLDEVLDNLSDDLRDTLDKYVATKLSDAAALEALGAQALEQIDSFLSYAESSPLVQAIDQKEFAKVRIGGPVVKALKSLRKAIA